MNRDEFKSFLAQVKCGSCQHELRADIASVIMGEFFLLEADNGRLKIHCQDYDKSLTALGRKCSSLEDDREYNAELV